MMSLESGKMATLKLVYNNGENIYLLDKSQRQIDFLVDVLEKFDPNFYRIQKMRDGSFHIKSTSKFSSKEILHRILLLSSCYENSIAQEKQGATQ